MNLKRSLFLTAAAICIAGCFALAQASAQTAVPVKKNEIGGVVTSPHGPEAGVWVIAETHDTPTRFARMVVTDDQGRYLVPDLPAGHYKVWARGYGVVGNASAGVMGSRCSTLGSWPGERYSSITSIFATSR